MKRNGLFLALPLLLLGTLAGCGGGSKGGGGNDWTDIDTYKIDDPITGSGKITVWVGAESVEFYQAKANEWVQAKKAIDSGFNFTVEVSGQDTGSAAGSVTQDPTTAADIYTVAHDNIGKLASGMYAKPYVDGYVYDQVLADNPASFKNVIYSVVNKKRAIYGVPYISQALFLMYDKRYVTAEQAQTFEGLKQAAAAKGNKVKAVTVMGTDGYNFSFPVLAVNNTTKATTVKLYENASKDTGSCWFQGDDTIAVSRYFQRYYNDSNGLTWGTDAGWESDLSAGNVIALVGGSWKYNSFSAAVGASNVGFAQIPTFTLTSADAEGLTGVAAGDVYRGGTFVDCKVFMINSYSEAGKYRAEQDLVKFFSSKEVQNESFLQCDNLPCYVGADAYIESIREQITASKYNLALVQNQMGEYGIPQPFVTGTFNTYYYSKGAPGLYQLLIENKSSEFGTLKAIREQLYKIQYIWQNGKSASKVPSSLPAQI